VIYFLREFFDGTSTKSASDIYRSLLKKAGNLLLMMTSKHRPFGDESRVPACACPDAMRRSRMQSVAGIFYFFHEGTKRVCSMKDWPRVR
jgi:hypothetical protein